MRKLTRFIALTLSILLIGIAIITINVMPVSANNAFTVDKAMFEMNVTPGADLPQTVTLSSDPTADPLDVNAEADGMGETNQGQIETDAQDDTPFSARTYIMNIKLSTSTPGTSVTIKFTINVPSNASPGEKYAVIRQ